ncbi:MAG: chemotaxis protein CheW [Eubacteriales bacterium]
MRSQVVVFRIGEEEYGFPIERVQEITRISEIHPIPNAPEYIKGLISIRGQALPLIDLHVRFGLKSESNCEFAIIVEINKKIVGMAVDEVKEVRVIENIAPPPVLITAPFITGIVNLSDRIIMYINPEKILETKEIIKIEQFVN